jgi:hypothetical protein
MYVVLIRRESLDLACEEIDLLREKKNDNLDALSLLIYF